MSGAWGEWEATGLGTMEQLAKLTSQLNAIETLAHIGSWEYDPFEGTTVWSPEIYRIFGIEPREWMTVEGVAECIHPADRRRFLKANERLVAGDPYDIEVRVCRPNGEERMIQTRRIRTVDELGQVRFMGTVQDITDQKAMQERIIEQEKLALVGQLAAGIAHDLRNPLTALDGFIRLLHEKYQEETRYFSIIENELSQINFITNQLLAVAKPHVLDEGTYDVTAILQTVVDLVGPSALAQNVEIELKNLDSFMVECNENQLRQAFLNIVKNAQEAMSHGGIVTILASGQGSTVSIRFTDEGTGIPENILKGIFKPFYTTKDTGTGLGLTMTKEIIEKYRGSIEIASEVGRGTTVIVHLPLVSIKSELVR